MAKAAYQVGKAQLEALTAPVRHDILDRLIAAGPLTVSEIGAALGRAPTAIYHHLRQLEAVGLVVAERPDDAPVEPGRPSLRYRAVGRVLLATEASRDPANRKLIARIARAATSQAARDFEIGLAGGARIVSGQGRNHTFFRAVGAPSPERLARMNALLDELAELVWTPDPKPGPLISVAWVMAPLDRPPRKARIAREKRSA